MKSLVFLVMLSGCMGDNFVLENEKPGQVEATALMWQMFGQTSEDIPPRVTWIEGDMLDCADGYAFMQPGAGEGGAAACVYGTTLPALNWSKVAWDSHGTSIGRTALAHELFHMALYNHFGDGDGGHTSADWQPGGLVDRAARAVRNAGL